MRRQLILLLFGFTALLSILFSAVVLIVFLRVEDRLFAAQLQKALQRYMIDPSVFVRAPRSLEDYSLHVGRLEEITPVLRPLIENRTVGYHEIEFNDREFHLMVQPQQAGKQHIYAVAQIDEDETEETRLVLALLAGVLATMVLAIFLGRFVARRIVSPVERLSEIVQQSTGRKDAPIFARTFETNEIGILARALEQYMYQHQSMLQRELKFAQEASHELRTPITVLQGVYDLLKENAPSDDNVHKERLLRLGRALNHMNLTVQSLLTLAREENRLRTVGTAAFEQQMHHMIETHRAILPDEVIISVIGQRSQDGTGREPWQQPLLVVALNNLLQNAVDHTAEGHITLEFLDHAAEVRDTGCGMSPLVLRQTRAFIKGHHVDEWHGLGLAIVRRICSRFDWRMEYESTVGIGTTARIKF